MTVTGGVVDGLAASEWGGCVFDSWEEGAESVEREFLCGIGNITSI